jgi:oxalate decarboxylase/phosphoglucose isomerase-like protein (cupin superfamily)
MPAIDLTRVSLLPAVYHPETGALDHPDNIVVEDAPVRRLKDMPGFFPESPMSPESTLYHMYNGVYRDDHRAVFDEHRIRYEYTMLLPLTVGGECNKAHGHVHVHRGGLPKGMPEAYEVLYGTGAFLLFTLNAQGEASVIVLNTKPGDRFIIPPQYYHLSVNTGTEPFIFGDLISMDTKGDYRELKERCGAPLLAFPAEAGVRWVSNPRYGALRDVSVVTVADLKWEPHLPEGPLYGSFLAAPEVFHFLHGA